MGDIQIFSGEIIDQSGLLTGLTNHIFQCRDWKCFNQDADETSQNSKDTGYTVCYDLSTVTQKEHCLLRWIITDSEQNNHPWFHTVKNHSKTVS